MAIGDVILTQTVINHQGIKERNVRVCIYLRPSQRLSLKAFFSPPHFHFRSTKFQRETTTTCRTCCCYFITHTHLQHTKSKLRRFFLLEIFQVQQQLTGDPSNGCNPTGCVVALDGHSPPSLSWPVPSRCIKVHSASSQPDTASAPSLNKFPVFRTRPIIGRGGTEEDAG